LASVWSRSRHALLAALALNLASVGTVESQQQSVQSAGPAVEPLTAWRRSMVRTLRPSKKGCFKTKYPDLQWTETNCIRPPSIPLRPHHGGASRRQTVGDGTDFSVQIPGDAVTMEGSFDSIIGLTSESGAGTSNAYTLQLNSEFFPTTTCTGGQPGCQGWEQFVFYNPVTSESLAFIQYWMLDYGDPCPSGWAPGGGTDCYRNSVYGVVVPTQTIAPLGQMTLTGVAPSGATDDSVTLSIGTQLYSLTGDAYFPDLAQHWGTSEFNVFGPGNSSQAQFNAGVTMVVRTAADSGVAAPSCVEEGFTAETNNLTLMTVGAGQEDSAWPSIVFMQSNASGGTPATCAALPAASDEATDGPLPLWALVALGAGLLGIGRHRLREVA
jgi:hypothetical protein